MGEWIKAEVAKAFKNYSNAAFQRRLNTPDLFSSAPVSFCRAFRCRLTASVSLREGDTVVLVRRGEAVQVWSETEVIGAMLCDDAMELIAALETESRAKNVAVAKIDSEPGFDNCFSIVPNQGGT